MVHVLAALDGGMPEIGGGGGLKIAEVLEEPGELYDNVEYVVGLELVVTVEHLDRLVVLYNTLNTHDRVEAQFLQHLPVATQVVLKVGVVHQKKVLNIGHLVFKLEVLLGRV